MANKVYPYQDKSFILKKDYVSKDGKVTKKAGSKVTIGWLIAQETKKVPVLDKDGNQIVESGKPKTKLDSPIWTMSRFNTRAKEYSTVNIMYHWFVQLLADLAGIQVEKPELIVQPRVDNSMTSVFLLTVKEGERVFYEVGEANSKSVAIEYPVSVAYKRAFDRVVLDTLRLYNAYSDVEAEEFRKDADTTPTLGQLTPAQRKLIAPWVQEMNNCKTAEKLDEVGVKIKEWKSGLKEVDEQAIQVLQAMFRKTRESLNEL